MTPFLTGFVIVGTLVGAAIPSEELVRLGNTFLNFLTIALLMWNQRKIRTEIDPKVNKILSRTEPLESLERRTEARESKFKDYLEDPNGPANRTS